MQREKNKKNKGKNVNTLSTTDFAAGESVQKSTEGAEAFSVLVPFQFHGRLCPFAAAVLLLFPLLHRLCSRSDDEQDIIDGGGFISPRFYSRMELEELMCCCYCRINSADLLILSSSSTQTHTYTQTRKHSLITSTVHKAADLNITPRYCSKMQHQIL